MEIVEIPRGSYDDMLGPCWWPVRNAHGEKLRPLVKCKCGKVTGISLHHVHADGTVTASFFDSPEASFTHDGKQYAHTPGCGWHVFIKLKDYDQGEFPPDVNA